MTGVVMAVRYGVMDQKHRMTTGYRRLALQEGRTQ